MKDKRYADVLALFDEMLATYKEGTKPDLEVADAANPNPNPNPNP